MPDDLYERDILVWAEWQAGLLGCLGRGERVNDTIDWDNLIEEVRDVGRSELWACESLLFQATLHLLKSTTWPDSQSAAHWTMEAALFLRQAARAFTPAMAQRIDIMADYADAVLILARARDDSGPPHPVPESCPFTLAELLAGDVDLVLDRMRPPD